MALAITAGDGRILQREFEAYLVLHAEAAHRIRHVEITAEIDGTVVSIR